jgi:hypothetical protein
MKVVEDKMQGSTKRRKALLSNKIIHEILKNEVVLKGRITEANRYAARANIPP